MIRCTPKGICSWNFLLDGDDHHADIALKWFGEQGGITADGVRFEIRKHGGFRRKWTLERLGAVVAWAQQSMFTGTFEVGSASGSFTLLAERTFGRRFRIERSDRTVATISPAHPFTRRSTIETFAEDCDFATLCFCFWLTALTWRRDSSDAQ